MPNLPEKKSLIEVMQEQNLVLNRMLAGLFMQRQLEASNKIPSHTRLTTVTTGLEAPLKWTQLCAADQNREEVQITLSAQFSGSLLIADNDNTAPQTLALAFAAATTQVASGFGPGSTQGAWCYTAPGGNPMSQFKFKTRGPLYVASFTFAINPVVITPAANGLLVSETLYTGIRSVPELMGQDAHAKPATLMRPPLKIDHVLGDEVFASPILH